MHSHTPLNEAVPPVVATLRVGEVVLADDASALSDAECRQRASLELLRQAAIEDGLLPADDPAPQDGVISEAAAEAIDTWLDRHLKVPEPDEASCRRHFAAHASQYAIGERVQARHILFAVTPGVDVKALRLRAEQALLDVRSEPRRFGEVAQLLSNCPSSAQGGDLGWLSAQDCAPEFARELFAKDEGSANVGVLPRLVHSRFGLHVVEVLARDPGQAQPFEAVQAAVAQSLRQQAWVTALRQAMQLLAGRWEVEGVDLDAADSPLLQ
ncbi:MAG TPA: peptidylprolyl isomerase [Aquabacterium sp.]|uniref:peptidylprolyl isomerase n=1 Tax=Aquabacterium sp. TaxID=1872578 RepID=UPI002E36B024|nr:peptidylprolyl isomerase [Aquabacterium sp.]HEX5372034.1 peptidylprolyl isomerase [Aquabacterium sp.]